MFYLYFFSTGVEKHSPGSLYIETFATKSYVLPIENFLKSGSYIEDVNEPVSQYIRTPGYGIFYLAFRLFSNEHTAKNLLIILQILLSGISVYYLAMTGYYIYKFSGVFYCIFGIYAVSAFVSMYDGFLISESLAISFLIFSLYSIIKLLYLPGSYRDVLIKLFWAGLFLMLSTFIRPTAAPLFLLIILFVVVRLKTLMTKQKIIAAMIFFVSIFGIIETSWLVRNYLVSGRLIPFQYNSWIHRTGDPVKDVEYHAYHWIHTVGDNSIFYEYNTLAAWFFDSGFAEKSYTPPPHIYTSAYNIDSLQMAKKKFLAYRNRFGVFSSDLSMFKSTRRHTNSADLTNEKSEAIKLNQIFTRYIDTYRHEKPFDFYILNNFRLLKIFLVHSGTGQLPMPSLAEMKQNKDFVSIFVKLSQSFLYWFILLAGIGGVIVCILKRNLQSIFLALVVIYGISIFPFFVKIIEIRFICFAYPFLAASAGICLTYVVKRKQMNLIYSKNQ
ncbi:hypothetical protein [Xanthocytophaga agilis]|uniref:Glycosyltransferase RgtA/B/C/D-like domain-containing protein n=1 Tax=Xanthocytophaga agilis TaxID=3048010 RepID=A0AAE3R889_9BACT|nr:hypothetical protein [Xanthocytophaga agilis]MDJ1505491.1 hypothetical protein [Xanthocytophaga agilis]